MKPLLSAARRRILTFTLIAALLFTGESRSEEVLPSVDLYQNGSLASGLFRTSADGAEIAIIRGSIGPISEVMKRTDFLLPDADGVAPKVGVAGELASRIIAAEGGPGPNPLSSAAGYGQFLRSTWLEMFARAYPQLSQKLNGDQILALREVKPLALDLTHRYAQENAFSLLRFGLPVTEASLFLAHSLGVGGAINILSSRPDQPVENILSRKAIAANPFMKKMTASTLQQSAIHRIRLPVEFLQPEIATPRFQEELKPLMPTEDFRMDGQTKASQALAENRNAIAALQNFLEAASRTGAGKRTEVGPSTVAWLESIEVDAAELLVADPTAVRVFNKGAARLVLDTVRRLAIRPAYREFKPIEGNANLRRELRPTVLRDVASALVEKMRRENATIITIVRHRRGGSARRPVADG